MREGHQSFSRVSLYTRCNWTLLSSKEVASLWSEVGIVGFFGKPETRMKSNRTQSRRHCHPELSINYALLFLFGYPRFCIVHNQQI